MDGIGKPEEIGWKVRALGALAESPCEEHQALASTLDLGPIPEPAVFTDLFGFQLYPYASVYLGPEGMMGGEARDRIAGFWRALGQTPPKEPDHLTVLLSTYAVPCERDAGGEPGWRRARGLSFGSIWPAGCRSNYRR